MFKNKISGIKTLKKWRKHENLDFGAIYVHCVQLLCKISMRTNTFVQSILPCLSNETITL